MYSDSALDYVLDASALLAAMLDEPGREAVQGILPRAFIHGVNVAEVLSRLMRNGVPPEEARAVFDAMGLPVAEQMDVRLAAECARLMAETRNQGLSLGDCVCLTVAAAARATAVTADRKWKALEGQMLAGNPIKVRLIR